MSGDVTLYGHWTCPFVHRVAWALAERGVPFSSPIGPAILDRTVVSATLAWMRLGLNPERMDRRDLLAAVRRPSRGLNRLAVELLGGHRFLDLAAVGASALQCRLDLPSQTVVGRPQTRHHHQGKQPGNHRGAATPTPGTHAHSARFRCSLTEPARGMRTCHRTCS